MFVCVCVCMRMCVCAWKILVVMSPSSRLKNRYYGRALSPAMHFVHTLCYFIPTEFSIYLHVCTNTEARRKRTDITVNIVHYFQPVANPGLLKMQRATGTCVISTRL